jgi:hypothetical protein
MRRNAAAIAAVSIWCLLMTSAALADPTGSKGSFQGLARCTNGQSYSFVVNNANGAGGWEPGSEHGRVGSCALPRKHVRLSSERVRLDVHVHAGGGSPQSFTNTDSRKNGKVAVTCTISGSQTDPAGNTFSLSGSVSGWIS